MDGRPTAQLRTPRSYRFQGSFGNSGINFRSERLPHWDIRGYQADMEVGPVCSGTLYECNGRR